MSDNFTSVDITNQTTEDIYFYDLNQNQFCSIIGDNGEPTYLTTLEHLGNKKNIRLYTNKISENVNLSELFEKYLSDNTFINSIESINISNFVEDKSKVKIDNGDISNNFWEKVKVNAKEIELNEITVTLNNESDNAISDFIKVYNDIVETNNKIDELKVNFTLLHDKIFTYNYEYKDADRTLFEQYKSYAKDLNAENIISNDYNKYIDSIDKQLNYKMYISEIDSKTNVEDLENLRNIVNDNNTNLTEKDKNDLIDRINTKISSFTPTESSNESSTNSTINIETA